MAANKLSILTPSVNNLTARIFVRAAGLEFEEVDVWGKKDEPHFVSKDPALLTPLLDMAPPDRMRLNQPGPSVAVTAALMAVTAAVLVGFAVADRRRRPEPVTAA